MEWIPAQVPGIENIDKQFRFTVKASRGEVIQVENFVRILAFRVNFSFWEKVRYICCEFRSTAR